MSDILYDIKNLQHRYGNGPVTLNIDSLIIKKGSIMGLVGPNGSGKSTLLKVLAFLEPYTEGTVLFDSSEYRDSEKSVRRDVTYLLQDSYLLKRSVYENIAYGLKLRGECGGIEERVFDSLERVGLSPEKLASRPWYRLSGGEVQRVALAARLALHPKVLLLDEPTANVDEASAALVKEAALSAWKEWGTTVIVATHDLAWLYEVSTEIVSLYRGEIAGRGAENFIQGKWRIEGDFAVRELADGQSVRGAAAGISSVRAGALSPSAITIRRIEDSCGGGKNSLRGIVTQMILEKGRNCVLVSVDAGDITLKSRISLEEAESGRISPASRVVLSFEPEDIRWL